MTSTSFKFLSFCLLFQLTIKSQNQLDYSNDQIAGYTFTGLGISTIAYTALGYNNTDSYNSNSALFYSIGSGLLVGGIFLLVKGEKKEPYQYQWKSPRATTVKTNSTLNYATYLFNNDNK